MRKKLVFFVAGNIQYRDMFKERGWEETRDMNEADLVQFTGGEDVSPHLYGELRHPRTGNNPARDEREKLIFDQALEVGVPMAGICRGGQFLNVMNKGSMWQHVDGHTGKHVAHVNGFVGDVEVSSTHHQMMRPSKAVEHLILMTASKSKIKECMNDIGNEGQIIRRYVSEKHREDDVEAVYYPDTKSLCYQPHPEFDNVKACRDVYFYFINNYLLKGVSWEDGSNVISSNFMKRSSVNTLYTDAIPF